MSIPSFEMCLKSSEERNIHIKNDGCWLNTKCHTWTVPWSLRWFEEGQVTETLDEFWMLVLQSAHLGHLPWFHLTFRNNRVSESQRTARFPSRFQDGRFYVRVAAEPRPLISAQAGFSAQVVDLEHIWTTYLTYLYIFDMTISWQTLGFLLHLIFTGRRCWDEGCASWTGHLGLWPIDANWTSRILGWCFHPPKMLSAAPKLFVRPRTWKDLASISCPRPTEACVAMRPWDDPREVTMSSKPIQSNVRQRTD